jgi:hypothetical protein
MKNSLRLSLMSLYCICGCALMPLSLGTEVAPDRASFDEIDAFFPGSIDGQAGWLLDQGVVDVVPGTGINGTSSIVVPRSAVFGQASLLVARPRAGGFEDEPPGSAARVTFLDFWVRLPPAEWLAFDETLDIDSARIGLFRNILLPAMAQWHVFNGDGTGGGNWINTGHTALLNSGPTESIPWTRLTIRQDLDRQIWDIWADGTLLSHALGFQVPPSAESVEVFLLGHGTEAIYFDELNISAENPLGPDADADGVLDTEENTPSSPEIPADGEAVRADTDADGLPDDWELRHGLDPGSPEDALSDNDGDGLNAFDEFALGTDPSGKDLVRRDASTGAAVFSRFAGTSARRVKNAGP